MVYERNTRDRQSGDYFGRPNSQDYGRDFRSDGGGYARSSAREYEAAGEYDRDDNRGGRSQADQGRGDQERGDQYSRDQGGRDYYGGHNDRSPPTGGDRYGQSRYGQGSGQGYGEQRPGQAYGQQSSGQRSYGQRSQGSGDTEYHGSYASDGRRFEDVGRNRDADDDNRRGASRGDSRGYGRQPQGYDYDDRGFIARAGDEVRSWFGDDEAERRREADARYDERSYGNADNRNRSSNPHDDHYHSWRSTQIAALDRDYDEYRNENRSKFENEFSSWRTERQGQRSSLSQVAEHMEVVGSDGSHVGTVDKVKGDRILLTKNDRDAGGVHHSIPSRWIKTVDGEVTLSKSADEAKAAWKEEERNSAMFEYGDRSGGDRTGGERTGADRTGGDKKDASATGYASTTQAGSTTTTGASSTTGTMPDTLGKSGSGTY
ncbi:Uncharacterized protein conserved in bacteria DUF2171 [Sphingomonas sp. HMP9]|uniref:DUF2171 domain-containing protein n=1 Tax=Sphingomonas sp. HMP9 TaxID=1517554 RepID=UPI0015967C99|nr:DUF2171 domain-containing protein [Sphingomonas sp. HMP9]BCA60961.1 Uncharacterized protein conserved in bacteria DUF2171 [Sphingomonas sp. HMP9]